MEVFGLLKRDHTAATTIDWNKTDFITVYGFPVDLF